MARHKWDPRCERPDDLCWPIRVGQDGLTRGLARGSKWRQCASSHYVPAGIDSTVVEQRIIEQAARLSNLGAVTAWAALRWYGATFFDGTAEGGRRCLPVPLVVGSDLRPDPRSSLSWEQLAPTERVVVAGLPCTTVQRALFDEMRRGGLWHAVRAMDMAAAAELISVELMLTYVEHRYAWTRVPLVREALLLAVDDSRSPQESSMRLVWRVVARLPTPVCNRPVFSLGGTLLGVPDLFDPEAGLVGEYDGADHLQDDRRLRDTSREERFRDHGLEYFRVVKGELGAADHVAQRMLQARGRAPFLDEADRSWTLTPPPWFGVPETLDERLVRLGMVSTLTHC
ncbi:MAG TPA: hypothetical protein VFO98_07855 [Marmoricola sp.]|nr:hypothetical protein [Marmoricola sp.]